MERISKKLHNMEGFPGQEERTKEVSSKEGLFQAKSSSFGERWASVRQLHER